MNTQFKKSKDRKPSVGTNRNNRQQERTCQAADHSGSQVQAVACWMDSSLASFSLKSMRLRICLKCHHFVFFIQMSSQILWLQRPFFLTTIHGLLLLLLSHFSHVWHCATNWWQPTRLLCPWESPGKNPGVDCHFLLQWYQKHKQKKK